MDNRKIGLFDSGLGGLTVMRELMACLPQEEIIYFGDTGRVPYGSKSEETILKYTKSDIAFLQTFDLKAIVAACGTASSIALPRLQGAYNLPLIGVIDAASRCAVRQTKNGIIGVIGTAGTVRSGAYEKSIKKENPNVQVVSVPCPLFVPLVESGFAEKEAARLIAQEYLEDIIRQGADTLIMGCTHYPILKEVLADILGEGVTLVNPGQSVAQEVKTMLEKMDALSSERKEDKYHFYVSDVPDDFVRLGSMFLERPIEGHIARIDIEKYME